MRKDFGETKLDELAKKFRDSNLNLPEFTKRKRVPYRLLKEYLKSHGVTDFLRGNRNGERALLLEEFYCSGRTIDIFAKKRGINPETLKQWISTDRATRKRLYPGQGKKLVIEFQESDFLTMTGFAKSKGISPDRFKYWLNQFDPERNWKRHGETVKRRTVDEFSKSGLTAPAFARSKGIKPITFGLWLRQFDPERTIPNRKAHQILSPREQSKLIAKFLKSGNLAKDFAAEHGINPRTFSTWVVKYRKLLDASK